MFIDHETMDPTVAQALDLIERDMRKAALTAIGRITSVLEGNPAETRVLHLHAGELHDLIARIDGNRERRTRKCLL